MAPTLVFDKASGQLVMTAGSPGGAVIIHYTAKTLYATLHWGMNVQQAISLPNFGSLNGPTLLEEKRFPGATVEALKARGHEVREQAMTSGLQGIQRTPTGFFGGADPRREGVVMPVYAGAGHAGKPARPRRHQGPRPAGLRRQHRPGRLLGQADSQGNWSGLDVDVCKAIAAAVLGDANKVKWVPLNAQQRFTALQSGEIDILSRNTTWTLTRDASLGLNFTGVTYYDGQGFMVPDQEQDQERQAAQGRHGLRAVRHHHREEPDRLLRANNLNIKPVVFEKLEATNAAYFSGRCQAYTTDASGLASIRNKEAKNPADHLILPELISKEPLGPACAAVTTSSSPSPSGCVYALIEAEEYGITQANVDELKPTARTRVGRAAGHHRKTPASCWAWTRLGWPRHQGRGQLRRDLRAQRRPEEPAGPAARQPTTSGPRAASCTPRRCAEHRPAGPGAPAHRRVRPGRRR
jgi:general L-amino acid transport system substrate-binding protein